MVQCWALQSAEDIQVDGYIGKYGKHVYLRRRQLRKLLHLQLQHCNWAKMLFKSENKNLLYIVRPARNKTFQLGAEKYDIKLCPKKAFFAYAKFLAQQMEWTNHLFSSCGEWFR